MSGHTPGKMIANVKGPEGTPIVDLTVNGITIVHWTGFDACDLIYELQVNNAARLALCWNSHDDLVQSLRECLAIVTLKCGNLHDDTNQIQDRARAALALAEAKEDRK